ncbi:NAD(P)-binding protein [Rhizodiscina lignyota]|uniref:NAD(P)-binding protein n=1 Tax=Rhizodiscina lignyota TaxID=1504668 RepID=A0A9P4IHL7_9PEZI|nr:NAD(P)-binding protein [Rhizodiscina lignyota]
MRHAPLKTNEIGHSRKAAMTTYQVSDSDFDVLRGKTVLITGGVQGIGLATVELAHRKGANVVLGDWKEREGVELSQRLKERILFHKCDVSKWDDVVDLFEAGIAKFGIIHTVICNAGINSREFDEDKIDSKTGRLQAPNMNVLDVNLYGVVYAVKCALHYFGKWPQTKCQIVITGSVGSFIDGYDMHLYMASKTGVLGLMRGLRTWVVEKNMTINLVAPWATDTAMLRQEMRDPWGDLPLNQTSDIARALLLPAVCPEVNGKSFWVGGGEIVELEDKLHESQPIWLGKKMSENLDKGQRQIVRNWEKVILSYKNGGQGRPRSRL